MDWIKSIVNKNFEKYVLDNDSKKVKNEKINRMVRMLKVEYSHYESLKFALSDKHIKSLIENTIKENIVKVEDIMPTIQNPILADERGRRRAIDNLFIITTYIQFREQYLKTGFPKKRNDKNKLSALSFFRNDQENLDKFLDGLRKGKKPELVGNVWKYGRKHNTIIACLDALFNYRTRNDEHIVDYYFYKNDFKVLYEMIKSIIDTPIKFDNFRKWQYDYSDYQHFEKKIEKLFRDN